MQSIVKGLLVLGLAASASGCQFYSVSGAESPTGHLTHNWACWQRNGNARFTDLKTGQEVTRTQSRLEPIPFDEAFAELAAASTADTRRTR